MRSFLFCVCLCAITIVCAQNSWIRIDRPESQFITHTSLEMVGYQIPCSPCITKYPKRFEILDFYINKDCNRFKIRMTYSDLSRIDTSDLKYYFLAKAYQTQNSPQIVTDADSATMYNYLPLNKVQVTVDTNNKKYLLKTVNNQLYALQFFWESHDSIPSKLKRISGAVDFYVNQECSKNSTFPYTYFHGGFGQIEKPLYTIDNLRYMSPTDTITVYGNFHKPTGFSYRTSHINIHKPRLSKYYNSLGAVRYIFDEATFAPIENSSTFVIPIEKFTTEHKINLGTFVFNDNENLQLPELSTTDSTTKATWIEYSKNTYGLWVTIITNFDDSRKFNVFINEGQPSKESLTMHLIFPKKVE